MMNTHSLITHLTVMLYLVTLSATAAPRQTVEPTKQNTEELAGSRWQGTIEWSEKRSSRNRTVAMPYSVKVSLAFASDGTCTIDRGRSCTWEKKENNVNISVPATKKDCRASGTLVIKDDVMTGSWDHYGGFTCYLLPPVRIIKLKRQ